MLPLGSVLSVRELAIALETIREAFDSSTELDVEISRSPCKNHISTAYLICENCTYKEDNEKTCHITKLRLGNLGLGGIIHDAVGDLQYLTEMALDFNMLSGSIPDELGSLSNLARLQLAENQLSGSLPSTLGNLSSLIELCLSSNYLTGKLPESYGQLRKLQQFKASGNSLSGQFPHFVKNWPEIRSLKSLRCSSRKLLGNNFEGPIPTEVFNLSMLESLTISDVGTSSFQLPSSPHIPQIKTLILRNCSINGSIPMFISESSSLKFLDLSFNNLTGGIPETWKPFLIHMSFARNNLTGTIPAWIFHSTRTRMDLSYNNFSEINVPVPAKLNLNLFACCCCQSSSTTLPYMLNPSQMAEAYFPKKRKFFSLCINCGGDQITINEDIYEADNKTDYFCEDSNRNWAYSCSGDFFVETFNSSDFIQKEPYKVFNPEASLYENSRLSPVSLNYYGLSLYEGTYNVTLHFAEIVYKGLHVSEVANYNKLSKRLFDVYIQGERVLSDFNIRDEAGDYYRAINKTFSTQVKGDGLLDIHLYWAGKGSQIKKPSYNGPLISAISVNPDFKVGGGGLSPLHISLLSVASVIISLLLMLLLAWAMGFLESKELQAKIKVGDGKNVTLKELIRATGNFSLKKKIGTGSLGTVYEAEVLEDQKVAVKKLSSRYKKRIHKLKLEVFNMKSLAHENLLKLWDVHIGKGYQLLVYEYMEYKSLENALFGSCHLPKSKLNWETRFSICLGIARGLAYLHEPHRSVIHGNIKTANILLDDKCEPKLSDLRLAGVHSDKDQLLLIKEEAPKGINAPEYFQGILSPKTDVYSFGMAVLIIVSGRKSEVDKSCGQGMEFLLDTAYDLQSKGNRLIELVDRNLYDLYDAKQALTLLNLAVKCTSSSPSMRPTISQVLSVLDGKKTLSDVVLPDPSTSSTTVYGDIDKAADSSRSITQVVDIEGLS
ncbi:probable LRR receptor-like serine/threonine-protein kinase At1g53430 [Morus notabilis]|uniref:probable LRR receptor-like serine/threonine-protein kinase At1g53430 n=1 Tax=Morus notabilis TaxID=981085 RepID=UPI000CED7F53|nr:probable LRR receptor-like serine/threonine-protein kinase At1g53430 [Morus notabilis]